MTADRISEVITIDGYATEASWKKTKLLEITVQDGSIGKVTVSMHALYDSDNIYIHAMWDDPTRDVMIGKWTFDIEQDRWIRRFDKTNHHGVFLDNEDRLAFFWNIDESIAGFNIGGCAMLCHGDQMHTNAPGERADNWQWEASRNNPLGYMDDYWLDNTIAENHNHNVSKRARKGDERDRNAGTKGMKGNYVENVQEKLIDGKRINIPWYWEPDAEGEDSLALTQDEIERGEATLITNTSDLDITRPIPGYILTRPTGSRGDIDAKGVWKDGKWSLEIKRRLVTGHNDDVQFNILKVYRFGIAVMDNTAGFRKYGEGHSFDLGARTLEFGGLGSEEMTRLSLISDYLTTARAYIGSGDKGLAYSEINNALALYNSLRYEVAGKDPVLYLEIKNRFIDSKRSLLTTDIESLIRGIEKVILTFQGKRIPASATLGQQLIIIWGEVQVYVFIMIALFAIYPIYKTVKASMRPSFRRLSIFLFIIVVPLLLEGLGRFGGIIKNTPLQNLSFMTSESATFLWALLMLSALFMVRRGFGDIEDSIESLERYSNQLAEEVKENSKLVEDLKELLLGTIKSLSSAIDAKSHWTRGHSERVTKYAMMIGRRMGLDNRTLKKLMLAALLHDIGKIGTLETLLNKPGRLTEEEYEMVKEHPGRGAEILNPIKQLKDIIPAIRHHHEHYNGGGYPDGIKGEAIPLIARILCVVDTYDSMISDRPYRKAPGKEKAIEEIKRCSGTQFDPRIVNIFLKGLEGNCQKS
ncbi:MAG: HD domain-containing phosphohydrolase [Thermodesulfobacteriota bacterium]